MVCTIGLIVFVFLFIKFRERRLQQEKRELENIVAERTREVVEQKEIIEAKNKDITDSINYARRIQEALLPPGNLESQAFSDSFVLFRPKDIVSGDFYWFEPGRVLPTWQRWTAPDMVCRVHSCL